MSDHGRTDVPAPRVGVWAWFVAWALVGAILGFGFVSFVLWVILLPVGFGLVALLALSPAARSAPFGLLSGIGIALLVVAYIQRDGPGTTCWRTATGGGCEQHLDPRPWLIAGLLFLLGGVVSQAMNLRQRRASTSA